MLRLIIATEEHTTSKIKDISTLRWTVSKVTLWMDKSTIIPWTRIIAQTRTLITKIHKIRTKIRTRIRTRISIRVRQGLNRKTFTMTLLTLTEIRHTASTLTTTTEIVVWIITVQAIARIIVVAIVEKPQNNRITNTVLTTWTVKRKIEKPLQISRTVVITQGLLRVKTRETVTNLSKNHSELPLFWTKIIAFLDMSIARLVFLYGIKIYYL